MRRSMQITQGTGFGDSMRNIKTSFTVVLLALLMVTACAKRQTPVPAATQPPPTAAPPQIAANTPPPAPRRVDDALPVPAQPAVSDDSAASRSIDDLNRNSPFKPV